MLAAFEPLGSNGRNWPLSAEH